MPRMTDDQLLRILDSEEDAAAQYNSGTIARDREQALRDYLRMPYGTEQEGRSQVVASDVFDTIEGMLPDLLEPFTASDEAVRFDPTGPEDVAGAEQATNACNYVFHKQNPGWLIAYQVIKDGLQMKTGGVKWWWDVRREASFTTYRGVPEMQLALHLVSHPDDEVVEQERHEEPQEPVPDPYTGELVEQPPRVTFDVKIKTVKKKGRVKVVNLPPDELLVSKKHNSILLDDCPYVAHVCKRTLSDILQMGFDVTVDDVRAAANDQQLSVDRELRENIYDGQNGYVDRGESDHELDDSMVEGWLKEEYVLVDYDGDGIAERRRIIRLGQKLLDNEECSHVQIAAWTPIILTHRFNGMSVAEIVHDFQKIATDILRNQIDNLALANNQETVVLADRHGNVQADIDSLLNRVPGGVLIEYQAGAIRPYMDQWTGIQAQPMIEQLQVAKENRTGFTRYSQGLDADSLNKTKGGMTMIMNASQKRMKLMARIAAEAVFAPMFRGIFKTLTDYCMDKVAFRLHGKFVQYDPQEWRDGYDMTVAVGLGTGDKDQQLVHLMQLEAAQRELAMAGAQMKTTFVTPQNIYNLQKRKAELAGFKDVSEFFTDPSTVPPQPPAPPPPPDPKVMLDQAKLQQQAALEQAKLKQEGFFKGLEFQLDRERLQLDRDKAALEAQESAKEERAWRDIESAKLMDKNIDRAQDLAQAMGPIVPALLAELDPLLQPIAQQVGEMQERMGAVQQQVTQMSAPRRRRIAKQPDGSYELQELIDGPDGPQVVSSMRAVRGAEGWEMAPSGQPSESSDDAGPVEPTAPHLDEQGQPPAGGPDLPPQLG